MREILALTRAEWLSAVSYRVAIVLSLGSLVGMILPIYFIAGALQPVMEGAIRGESDEYFAFIVVGLIASQFMVFGVTTLPGALQKGIGTGTLESLFCTRAPMGKVLAGLMGYPFVWAAARGIVLLVAGVALGMNVAWTRALVAAFILILIGLAYVPVGLVCGALVLSIRNPGPIPQGVIMLSGFLGGIYYPTHVIPSWLRTVSDGLPLTYGLRALRRTLLEGVPVAGVAADVLALLAFVAALFVAGILAMSAALSYSRRTGSLAQY